MPRGPLADDWLYWDPEAIFAYPHSREPDARAPGEDEAPGEGPEPLQLDLFKAAGERI